MARIATLPNPGPCPIGPPGLDRFDSPRDLLEPEDARIYAQEIQVGEIYIAKLSKGRREIVIEAEDLRGGWAARSTTRRPVWIRSADQLRRLVVAVPRRRRRRGRISAKLTPSDRRRLAWAEDLPISTHHIAWTRTAAGDLVELFVRTYNGSPAVWKAPDAAPIAADGKRWNDSGIVGSGAARIRWAVRDHANKTPRVIGIQL